MEEARLAEEERLAAEEAARLEEEAAEAERLAEEERQALLDERDGELDEEPAQPTCSGDADCDTGFICVGLVVAGTPGDSVCLDENLGLCGTTVEVDG